MSSFSVFSFLLWLISDQRPFVCSVESCGKSYTRSWHLRRHVEKAHQSAKDEEKQSQTFPCTWTSCNKQYSSRDALNKHVARVHEGREHVGRERPGERLSCTFCGLSFAKHTRLKAHLFQHTGERHFKCVASLYENNHAFEMRFIQNLTNYVPFVPFADVNMKVVEKSSNCRVNWKLMKRLILAIAAKNAQKAGRKHV